MWPSSSVFYMVEMVLDKKGILRPVLVTNIDLYWFTSRPVLVRSLTSTGREMPLA